MRVYILEGGKCNSGPPQVQHTQCVACNMWRHTVGGMQYAWQMTVSKKMWEKIFMKWKLDETWAYTYWRKTNKCNFCHKRFCWKGNLIEHGCMHSEEKPSKCKFCEKRFSWNRKMIEHKCTHSEEKPFKCKFCEKRFSWNGNLNEHKCTHSEEKPFKC